MEPSTPFEQTAFEWWCDAWLDQQHEGWSDDLPLLKGRFVQNGAFERPLTKEEIVYGSR